jgi:hypothetical protein
MTVAQKRFMQRYKDHSTDSIYVAGAQVYRTVYILSDLGLIYSLEGHWYHPTEKGKEYIEKLTKSNP